MRRLATPGSLALLVLLATGPWFAVEGCPFCSSAGQTLSGEVEQAKMVLFGQLVDPNEKAETTDLLVEAIVKDHPARAGRLRLTLSRYYHPALLPAGDRFLVFCDLHRGKIDPYRSTQVKKESKLAAYLGAARSVKNVSHPKRLRFFFDYLDHPEQEISADAYKEYGNASYPDVASMARDLPVKQVERWLLDPDTPRIRFGLYGLLLGHCGKEEQARLLRKVLDDPRTDDLLGSDGILAGYVLLSPKEGWSYLSGILRDPGRGLTRRYAVLRVVRFFLDYRTDVVPTPQLLEGVWQLLEQSDVADLAIEELRRRGTWQRTGLILGLHDRPSHSSQMIRRAILDYALAGRTAPDAEVRTRCETFVAQRREKSPDLVAQREEQLRREAARAVSPARIVAETLSVQALLPGAGVGSVGSVVVALGASLIDPTTPASASTGTERPRERDRGPSQIVETRPERPIVQEGITPRSPLGATPPLPSPVGGGSYRRRALLGAAALLLLGTVFVFRRRWTARGAA